MFRFVLILAIVAVCARAFAPTFTRLCKGVSLNMCAELETDPNIGAVGSKLTNDDLAREAINKFFPSVDAKAVDMVPTTGGVNNIVQYLTFPDGSKKLLRIYNNGEDTQQVTFEHAVLSTLWEEGYADKFDFKIPKYMPFGDSGNTFAKLSNGAEACIVDFIDGSLPKISCLEPIGKASGELCTALGKITDIVKNKAECNCDPYYEMWEIHTAITKENFIATMKGPDFDGKLRPFADLMLDETIKITEKCEGDYKDLPEQLLHGDLHYDNVLVKDGAVTGLLDFEFALFDWRAMELATCLSKYAGEANGMELFEEFVKGYAITGELTHKEAEAIPDLINLRVLSNVVYFVGRAIAKEDKIDSLTKRIENYSERVKWIQDNEKTIIDIIKKYYPSG